MSIFLMKMIITVSISMTTMMMTMIVATVFVQVKT